MTISYTKFFQPLQVPLTSTLIATVPAQPASNVLINGRVRATNITATAATITLYAVPVGGTASGANTLVAAKSVAPNDWLDSDLPEMLAGDMLYALAGTVSAITLHYIDGLIRS